MRPPVSSLLLSLWLSSSSPAIAADWPDLAGRVGPYGGADFPLGNAAQNAEAMARDGFSLALVPYQGDSPLQGAFRVHHIKYIDATTQGYLWSLCAGQLDKQRKAWWGKAKASCRLGPDDLAKYSAQLEEHLRRAEKDETIAGFWILDDYPHGDVTSLLRRAHDLVAQSNARRAAAGLPPRPTICGFGGSLDRFEESRRLTTNRQYTELALFNVSPVFCDLVSPYMYGYGPNGDPTAIDWSMTSLLPHVVQELKAIGFDPRTQMLPIVQAFGLRGAQTIAVPRAEDIEHAMKAYCDAGAISLMFFTWRDRSPPEFVGYVETESFRAGVQAGTAYCQKLWGR